MKNLIFILFLLFFIPTGCFCQKIVRSEYDKEGKKFIIETSAVQAKMDLDDILGFRLVSEDTTIHLIVTGVGGGAGKVNQGDKLIFRLANDSTVVATSIAFQIYTKGKIGDTYTYVYAMTQNGLMKLRETPLKTVRIYVSYRFVTLEINEKRSGLVSDLAKLFLKEYSIKKELFKTY
jgi:hypothetical protein